MFGTQIEEGRGKRTGRRILATDPQLKVEASVEEMATVLGAEGMLIVTYTSTVKPDGSLYGEGEAAFAALTGEMVTWKGIGVGRFGEGGSIHYSGSLSFLTASPKFAKLNGTAGVFHWDIDAQGNTHSRIWEFAEADASQGAGA